jgi:energy-coupling factor transporter ATP-binding protein EcfA2
MDVVIGERYRWDHWEPFGISVADRRHHVLLLGKTGMGKSTLFRNMLVQDIAAGRGVLFIDPHGDEAERLLDYIPPWRTEDVVYLDLSDLSHPIGLNVLEREPTERRPLIASNVVSIFKHFWSDAWGARSEYLLLCSVAAILDYPDRQGDVSLLAVQRLLNDPLYRERVVRFSRNHAVRSFWDQEFPTWAPQFMAQALSPLQNKLGALFAAPAMQFFLGQAASRLRIAEAMDERKIIIARLPKGLIGEDNTNIAGSLLVNAVQHAAMRRADTPEEGRIDFACYLDEFTNFTTDSFAAILSELRKYHVGFVLSGQFLAQMRKPVRDAIIGNAGTIIAFQSGLDDADLLAPIFEQPNIDNLVNMNRGEIAAKLMMNGHAQPPFFAHTYPEIGTWYADRRTIIRDQSARRYGRPRAVVEDKLRRWNPPPEEAVIPPALIKKTRPVSPRVLVNIQNFYESVAHDGARYDAHAAVLKKLADIRSETQE